MELFAFGAVSLVFAAALPLLYLVTFGLRLAGAWIMRTPKPTDRVGPWLLIAAIVGLAFGSYVQPLWDEGVECRASGQPIVACLFSSL